MGVINEPKPLTEPDPAGDAVGIVKVPLALTLTVVEDDCVMLIVTTASASPTQNNKFKPRLINSLNTDSLYGSLKKLMHSL